jgi:hypothetical protein
MLSSHVVEVTANTLTSALIKEYELDPSTQDVIGHALCLYTSADWQNEKVCFFFLVLFSCCFLLLFELLVSLFRIL